MKRVLKNGSGEIVEKKSRFISHIYKVENEQQAQELVAAVKKQYWDARHNCYAYICGEDGEIQRFSDDGEPSGTAGKPMLEILQANELTNCLVVVTRYFGGVLLGTGGLIRAYSASLKEGLANSVIGETEKGIVGILKCEYTDLGKIQYICNELNITTLDTQYTDKVELSLLLADSLLGTFEKKLTELSSGALALENMEEVVCFRDELDKLFME